MSRSNEDRKGEETGEALTVREVAKAVGVSPRTVRHYTAIGLFEGPPFRGVGTRYERRHLEQLLAIQALRKQKLGLATIKARLEAEAAARAEAARVDAAKASEAPAPSGAGAETALAAELPETGARPGSPAYPAEAWERVVLLPGLELLVNTAGGAILRRLAAEIYAQYGSAAGRSP